MMKKELYVMESKPIRVAHIIGKWLGGGVESVVMNYYRNIDKDKVQFDFICDDDSTNIPYDEIESLGGKVILVPPYQHIFKYQKRLKEILKNGQYSMIHSHINTLSIFPLCVAKRVGIPIRIAHSHSTTHKKEWKRNLLKQILRPFSKVYATDYFCCSELAGRWLFGNKAYENGDVYLLNNAIDLKKFQYSVTVRKRLRKELNIDQDTFVIGHVGRFVTQKNHSFLIDVFYEIHKKHTNTVLVLIGQGPLQEEIKSKVMDLGLEKSVIFLGQRDDVYHFYQVFDTFVFPSLYEGLGMVLIEAQCSGLKCVTSTEVPSIAKVTDYVTFIDLDRDAAYWANEISKDISYIRKDCSEEVRNHGYDIKLESKRLEKVFLGLLK